MSNGDHCREVYEQVLQEHEQLRALISEIHQMVTRRSVSTGVVAERLQRLCEHLERHFQTEEASDCFTEMVSHAPRVAQRVFALIDEHREMMQEAQQVLEHVRQSTGTAEQWGKLAADFHELSQHLMRHESVENELLQEAFTEDIGSKD